MAAQKAPALQNVDIDFVILIDRRNIRFCILCLIETALQIVIPECAVFTFVVNKIPISSVGHPGHDIVGSAQATFIKHGRGLAAGLGGDSTIAMSRDGIKRSSEQLAQAIARLEVKRRNQLTRLHVAVS
jgi:hypothetical protein